MKDHYKSELNVIMDQQQDPYMHLIKLINGKGPLEKFVSLIIIWPSEDLRWIEEYVWSRIHTDVPLYQPKKRIDKLQDIHQYGTQSRIQAANTEVVSVLRVSMTVSVPVLVHL